MDSPEMIRTRGDGIDIQLAQWKGEGRAILCVHGLTANCRCWDTMAASLAPRYKLIALDLRGRGLSEKPPEGYFVEQHCRDIEAVIENLGIERPILMGHSLGALIALVFTALRPELSVGLVLVDGAGCSNGGAARENADRDQARPGQTRTRLPVLRRVYRTIEAGPFSKPLVRGPGTLFPL